MKTTKSKPTLSQKEKTIGKSASKFPIVGIGTSAGGLEALELFLSNVPENSGMAYIVIQHLDPTQKGMLPDLLQRVTKLKVFQVIDGMPARPNCVYVIPPNKSMSVLRGVLYLFAPLEERGLRLPIDFFFRSLADDLQERSVGIILSGMGSDGCAGFRDIKEKNGTLLVQTPETAKFDSMPRSAIDSVLVDIVAPANELPTKLITFLKRIPFTKSDIETRTQDKSALDKIIILLRTHTGNDFSLYKKNTLYRRIERRMAIHKIEKITLYVQFLQENSKEIDILFKELIIGVTNFFRDPGVWEKIQNLVFPNLIATLKPGSLLRAWIPGCSTGEEAYSLAILFKETVEKLNPRGGISLQIFATDIDNEAIEFARKGVFPQNIEANVSTSRLNRFFITTDEGYRVNAEIREMVVFAQHNIIMHPPFTKMDILSCRNLLIYMETELQIKILGLFYYSINPDGIMLLGSAETLGKQSHLFEAIDSGLKIYKRVANIQAPELYDFPSSFSRYKTSESDLPIPDKTTTNIQQLTDQLLLQHFSPPGVLVNQNGDIIYISGRTGKYLEPAVGKANLNIFAMLREGLKTEFPAAFRKAIMLKEDVVIRNLNVGTNGGTQHIFVRIKFLDKPEPLSGMVMIIFNDVLEVAAKKIKNRGKNSSDSVRELELEEELQHTREEIKNTMEEMQTSQEELKSTNEELQSANEELQSTNEELTTSKEEMQSLNEELQTVNAELQSKVDDFSRVNNDMKNLLNSTDIATLFLDKELNIRRFTNQATKIFKLIKSDIGRPFTDLVTDLVYPELVDDTNEVLRTLIFIQKQIPTKDGRWFTVRIMPYRTFDDRIDGLVITFFNSTDIKHLELKLLDSGQMQHLLLNSSSDVILKLSNKFEIQEFNPAAERFFGKKSKNAINHSFIQLFVPQSTQKKYEKDLNKQLNDAHDGKINMQVIAAEGKLQDIEWTFYILYNNLKIPTEMMLIAKEF